MKKRIFSFALALVMIFGIMSVAGAAAETKNLRFDENGEFKIMHIADCQDGYPANETMLMFIDAALKEYQPDLVVLGGDNSVGPDDMKEDDKKAAIEELTEVFVSNKTYFTLVFGNHDHQQGFTDDQQLVWYQQYGGEYCLAYDEDPSLAGTATHALPVLGSKSDETKFMLYMFDSNDYVRDENGKELGLGYDCVNEDQIEWYKAKSRAAEEANGKKKVPSMAFQHIVVGEVYDALFHETSISLGDVVTPSYNGKRYSFFPKLENIEEGFIFEFPCPGYYNYGQFDAMVERGDILAVFSGHDHINNYTTEVDGIKIINTAGATYNSYGNEFTRGVRMITLSEDDTWNFKTESVTVNQFAIDNPDFAEAAGINTFVAKLTVGFGDFLLALTRFCGIFSKLISMVVA